MKSGCVPGAAAIVLSVVAALAGCQTGGQTGALAGGGIGALAGQAIGGNTEATLIGAAVGTGIGYIIGNESDKRKAAEMESRSTPGYSHTETGSLAGTRWRLVSLAPQDVVPPYREKIVEFRPNGLVTTTTTGADGTVEIMDEHYRVVDRTLIVNKPGYIINARYAVDGNQLIVDAEKFRAVLEKM